MGERLVVDTSGVVAALKSEGGASREVLSLCLKAQCRPLIGEKLLNELESVMGRTGLFRECPLTARDRGALVDAFLRVCEWVPVFFLWRPNLPDEWDNNLIELAVAGAAAVTGAGAGAAAGVGAAAATGSGTERAGATRAGGSGAGDGSGFFVAAGGVDTGAATAAGSGTAAGMAGGGGAGTTAGAAAARLAGSGGNGA